ncbi:MAG: glycosyltransferase family 61 protein [Gemmobacter sp.]
MPNGFILVDGTCLLRESVWQSAINRHDDVRIGKETGWKYLMKLGRDVVECDLPEDCFFAYHRFYFQYFHWFIDCLPRLWIAKKSAVGFESYYCGEIKENGFQDLSLRALDVPEKRATIGHKAGILRFGSLLYAGTTLVESLRVRPSFNDGVHHKAGWDPEYLAHINQVIPRFFGAAASESATRIYIKRPSTGHRRLVGAEMFERFLKSEGFVFVDPGSFDFGTQVRIFRGAEFIVGAHGAGLTNILWCDRRKIRGILEIAIETVPDTGYTLISSGLGFRHYVCQAQALPHKLGPAYADLAVDSNRLIEFTKRMLGG